MGTKIEYSINLLAPSSVDSKKFSTDGGVNVWEHFQNKALTNNNNNNNKIGDKKLQDSMDRIPDTSNIQSIKKTMQIHEDIFKNQVRELHRVYSVQKMMMDELKNEIRQKKLWSNNGIAIAMNHPHLFQERSGSCSASGETKRKQKGFDLERPLAEEVAIFAAGADEGEAAAGVVGTRNNDDDGDDEEMEVDLTLSIGGSHVNKNNNSYDTTNNNNNSKKNKKKKPYMAPLGFSDSSRNNNYGKIKELMMMNSSVSFQSDRDCSDPTTPMSSSSVTYDQERERKGPHWLSQGLKLN